MIENGSLISLKDLITQDEWLTVMKKTKKSLNTVVKHDTAPETVDGVNLLALKKYHVSENLIIDKMIRYLYKKRQEITINDFRTSIEYDASDTKFQSNIRCGSTKNSYCPTYEF